MADDDKKGYPNMPVRQWWALRERLKRTLPSSVTPSYLASALGMGEQSARNNILPSIRATGLIDAEGKPTDLAVKWRDDKHYKEVCEVIRKSVYPNELLDLAPAEAADREEVQRWFSHAARVGQNAANKMATFYMLLCEADVSKASASSSSSKPNAGVSKVKKQKVSVKQKSANPEYHQKDKEPPRIEERQKETQHQGKTSPSLHLNIQIHISPEASAEQIDQIFSSMAKNLKDLM